MTPIAAPADDPKSIFRSTLAEGLITVSTFADQVETRNVNPWLEMMQSQFKLVAEQLREAAFEEVAVEMGLVTPIRDIADNLDRAASHVFTMGGESWKTYTEYVLDARARASEVMAAHIDPVPLSEGSKQEIRDLIRKSARQLFDLDDCATEMANDGRMEELQTEASRLGSLLLRLSYYRINDIAEGLADSLRPIANELDLIETERMYLDGGQSMRRILEALHDLSSRLQALLSKKNL